MHIAASDRREDRIRMGVVGGAFLYVLLRALLVPPIHDECASLIWFVWPGEWLPGQAHWDANNHYLSTAIGIGLHRLLGGGIEAVRLGSVLAFIAYLFAGIRLARQFGNGTLRLCFIAAWSWCPFVLDLFALFRGYGLALAAWSWALVHALELMRTGTLRKLIAMLLAAVVANMAIVALVPPWAELVALAPVLMMGGTPGRAAWGRKHWAAWVLLGVAPLAALARLAVELQERGLLYHGRTDGLVEVTVASLARLVLGSDHGPLLVAVVAVVLAAIATLVLGKRRSPGWSTPGGLVALLMLLDLLGRVVLARAFGINYPEDRAAVHLVPEALLLIAFAVQEASARWPRVRHARALLLVFPLISLWDLNVDHTRLWPEQSIPRRFVERIVLAERKGETPLVVGGHHQLVLCWSVLAGQMGSTAQLQSDGFPAGLQDWRIVDARHIDAARPGYRVADHARGPGLWLLERARPLRRQRLLDRELPATKGSPEFLELIALPDSLQKAGALRIGLHMALAAEPLSPDLALVWEVNAEDGAKLRYGSRQVSALLAGGDALRLELPYDPLPGSRRAVFYLYNPQRALLHAGPGQLRIDRVGE